MTDDVPDRIWAFYAPDIAEDENGATIVAYDTVQFGGAPFLSATPARLHAEELADLLREALEELDDYYRAEYDTDHPYHQDKLTKARDAWQHARALLASLEQEDSK